MLLAPSSSAEAPSTQHSSTIPVARYAEIRVQNVTNRLRQCPPAPTTNQFDSRTSTGRPTYGNGRSACAPTCHELIAHRWEADPPLPSHPVRPLTVLLPELPPTTLSHLSVSGAEVNLSFPCDDAVNSALWAIMNGASMETHLFSSWYTALLHGV